MFKTDNSLHVFVARSSHATTALTSIATAAAGDIMVSNQAGTLYNAHGAASSVADDGDLFKIGQKDSDGNIRWSPLLKYNTNTFVKTATSDVARTQQLSVFGSTGDAGSIDPINSNRYSVRVVMKNNVDVFSEQSDQYFFEYVSDANATQAEIANYFAQNMSKITPFAGGKDAKVKVERFSSATFTAINVDLATFTATRGSKAITFSAGTMTELVAGRYVRINGGTDAQDETIVVDNVASDANVDPVYKIESVDATNKIIYLDQPFQMASSTLYEDQSMQVATAATVEAGNMGIRIMGKPQKWSVGLHKDTVVAFDVTLDGWGDTTAVADTALAKGSGYYREVAELEWFGVGASGAPYRHGSVPNNQDLVTLFAGTSGYYNVWALEAELANPGHAVAGSGVGKCTVVVAAVAGENLDNLEVALNAGSGFFV